MSTDLGFNNVAIVGTGLLGGSLARELKAKGIAEEITGVCRTQQTARAALDAGIVDRVESLQKACLNANLIILATPMQAMPEILRQIEPFVPDSAIVTDVGSVKTELYQQIKRNSPSLLNRFVLAHPIAGGEHSGVLASKLGLFESKHVVITDTDEVPSSLSGRVAQLWQTVGAKVLHMSLSDHDAIFAKTSHLPHVIAFTLVNYLSAQEDKTRLFELAAAGFYDFTRIASSDAEMWRDICITNKHQILSALDGFKMQLEEVREHVESGNQSEMLNYFNSAKVARDQGLIKKSRAAKSQRSSLEKPSCS